MDQPTDVDSEAPRQDTTSRILDAAERLFRHYGYAKTNVADIARDLGMSPGNIYRFFASKVEIHQAICGRILSHGYERALAIRHSPGSAVERLERFVHDRYQLTVETMLDESRVHEMVVVAIERDWHVIEAYLERVNALLAEIIAEGMEAGEFRRGDPVLAASCFSAATATLCHPQLVAQCLHKASTPPIEALIDFAIAGLR